ncbi:hypothetical protein EGM88_03945 [Aureibaculum marinum]|uniref:TonB-dependent receptor plug domain-containing protein n=1 Tax=Aureibaculum marinum TaxID=2487930 RepID=A0A3N4NRZ7_9FLAO|nr:hypothetical protein [Aureibaculum marinum]RPD99152.1 hypothetical protein EGM88_03945 [Aureibaculum marinum]
MKKLISTVFVVLLSISLIQAQEKKNKAKENIVVKVKEGAKPDIYVDGKKFDFPMELLDNTRIESINVIKGDKALKEYNSPNGVLLIKTKKEIDSEKSTVKIYKKSVYKEKEPLIIIDGKTSNQELLKKLSPDDIESINVVKGETAIKKYKAPNGVIIVITKKVKDK